MDDEGRRNDDQKSSMQLNEAIFGEYLYPFSDSFGAIFRMLYISHR